MRAFICASMASADCGRAGVSMKPCMAVASAGRRVSCSAAIFASISWRRSGRCRSRAPSCPHSTVEPILIFAARAVRHLRHQQEFWRNQPRHGTRDKARSGAPSCRTCCSSSSLNTRPVVPLSSVPSKIAGRWPRSLEHRRPHPTASAGAASPEAVKVRKDRSRPVGRFVGDPAHVVNEVVQPCHGLRPKSRSFSAL